MRAFERRRRVVGHHEVVELRQLRAAAAQLPLEAVDRPEVKRALGAWVYARALYKDPAASLDDLREAVTTLEDAGRIARRVFGGAHPLTEGIRISLHNARAALRARATPPGSG